MERYSRLLELNNISKEKLLSLSSKRVLIIGVGGVGQHVVTYLVTNGVNRITIVDFDKVELSNLNRQILLTEADLELFKVKVVKRELVKRNSDSHITAVNLKVDESNIDSLISEYDLVIDAVDNWKSKLIISKACHDSKVPLLHIGVDGYKGQYCLFINKSLLDIVDDKVISSPKDGVLGPMVGVISSLASLLAIHYLLNDKVEIDTLFYFDHLSSRLLKSLI